MEDPPQVRVEPKRNRSFILGSLSTGHGVSHLYDQGFPVILPAIASALIPNPPKDVLGDSP